MYSIFALKMLVHKYHFLESSTCVVGIYVIVLQISPLASEKPTGPAKAHVANKWES